MNQTAFEYFKASKYYDANIQIAENLDLKLPQYTCDELRKSLTTDPEIEAVTGYARQGMILCKASWRLLDDLPAEIQRRYSRHDNCHVLAPDKQWSGSHTLGLTGFHIVRSTPNTRGAWFWSTFKHVDNVQLRGGDLPVGATATLNPNKVGGRQKYGADHGSHVGVFW